MSAELQKQIDVLTFAVISLTEMMGARITRAQMLERLRVSSNTLTAGVRDGRFPKPANDGKLLLAEVIEWESKRTAPKAWTETLSAQVSRIKTGDISIMDLIKKLTLSTEPKSLPGVYFLIDKDSDVVYVGQSKNVLNRMAGHSSKEFRTVRMIHIENEPLRLTYESEIISLFNPPLNVRGIKDAA